MNHYSVIIVGAGPTGMSLAARLHSYGIKFLIIDKHPTHATTSNAAAIHARTLECWHGEPWFTQICQHGIKIKGATINDKQTRLAKLDFSSLADTQYPYILSIPQNHTEAVLDQYLTESNVPVQRNIKLQTITESTDKIIACLATPNGEQTISADWLVGCDGYHSTMRNLLNIPFAGDDIEERFLLADANFTANNEPDFFHIYITPKGILALFNMQGSTRIIAGIGHDPEFKDVAEPTLAVMQAIIKDRTNLTFTLNQINWQSHFWIHERLATTFKAGRILLAGDAAHVHSPAGGQGMNTGIQDGYNLAWKLAYVINGYSPVSLLNSYEQERKPNAKNVVAMTSKLTKFANIKQPILVYLRNLLLPMLAKHQLFQKTMIMRMSELGLHYQQSDIIKGKSIAAISPGQRARDAEIDGQGYLYDMLKKSLHYQLLVFHADKNQQAYLCELQNKFKTICAIHFYDATYHKLLKTYPFKHFTLCLIRPDQYISYLGDELNEFSQYFQSLHLKG